MWTLLLLPLIARAERPPNVDEIQLPDAGVGAFTFGPGDRLSLKVFKHGDLDAELTVAPDGTVTLPLLGRVQVAGRTYSELVSDLEGELKEYYTDASVAVNVVEVNNQKVFVIGEVGAPSVLQITGEMSVMEAVVLCGGVNQDARTKNLLLIRGELDTPELYTVDLADLMRGDLSQNVSLRRGDIIVVPTKTIANAERFFRRIQGILGPFVSGSQIYRNVKAPGSTFFTDGSGEPAQ